MALTVGKVFEFLIGFALADIVIGAVAMVLLVFSAPYVGVAEAGLEQYLSVGVFVIKAVVLGVLFFVRRVIAIGWLAGIVFDFLLSHALSAAGVV